MSNLGLHIGIVVDNLDPNQVGRVKVMSATLFGGGVVSPNWVDPVSPKGFYSVPATGDKVALIVENNDLRFVHYLGYTFSDSKIDGGLQLVPTEFENFTSPQNEIVIYTPLGNYIKLDDTTDKITIKATNVFVDGDLEVKGDLVVSGDISTATGDITAGTISLLYHTHTDPQGGTSGPPQ